MSKYKIAAYCFFREIRIRRFRELSLWNGQETPSVLPDHRPVLTIVIVVNQRRGQFPLQLYRLVCQASHSSQQLLIAGHWQRHVATAGGASAITQHAHFVEASLLSLPWAPQLSQDVPADAGFLYDKLTRSVRR